MKVPLLFLHVRVASDQAIRDLQPLRDDLVALARRYSDVYGVRVKRRQITSQQAKRLFATYQRRADP